MGKTRIAAGRRVSERQKIIIVEFMERNMGLNNDHFTNDFRAEYSFHMWLSLAAKLNAHGIGPQKELEKWKETWKDMKIYVKDKAAKRRAIVERTGGDWASTHLLTPLEERILSLSETSSTSAIEHANETGYEAFTELQDVQPPTAPKEDLNYQQQMTLLPGPTSTAFIHPNTSQQQPTQFTHQQSTPSTTRQSPRPPTNQQQPTPSPSQNQQSAASYHPEFAVSTYGVKEECLLSEMTEIIDNEMLATESQLQEEGGTTSLPRLLTSGGTHLHRTNEDPQMHHTMDAEERLAQEKQYNALETIGAALIRLGEAKERQCAIETEKLALEKEKVKLEQERIEIAKKEIELKARQATAFDRMLEMLLEN